MFEAHSINAEHKDLIHDIAYDYYGERMATCSSDQFVKVRLLTLVDEKNHPFVYRFNRRGILDSLSINI